MYSLRLLPNPEIRPTVETLKAFLRLRAVKGYSGKNRDELVELALQHLDGPAIPEPMEVSADEEPEELQIPPPNSESSSPPSTEHLSFDCGGLATVWHDVVLPASVSDANCDPAPWMFDLNERQHFNPLPPFFE